VEGGAREVEVVEQAGLATVSDHHIDRVALVCKQEAAMRELMQGNRNSNAYILP